MRLAAAVKPANPNGWLLRLSEVAEERFHDLDEPALVLAFADEGLQLEPQRLAEGFGIDFSHFGDAVVEQPHRSGIFDIQLAVLHGLQFLSVAVIGVAR